jgi:hypothetical protein
VAYEPCTAPDTTTDDYNFAACSAPVRSDPTCGFGPSGKGRFILRTSTHNIKVGFKLSGLDAGCEGSGMAVVIRWRLTSDACAGTSCTVFEGFETSWYGCTVTGGKCVLPASGTPFTFLPEGALTGAEVKNVEIVRDGTFRPFRIGVVIP